MRHRLMACIAVLALSACVLDNPHNDVLVFGTTTKVAIDVSAPVQNGAIPEFTIGYKRNEGVWMPLKANTAADESLVDLEPFKKKIAACEAKEKADYDARPSIGGRPGGSPPPKPPFDPVAAREKCMAKLLPPEKYLAHSSGIDSQKGGTTEETDTYSVFASFGGRGNLGFSDTAGSLAQFFATGIAAQRLGANPQLAAALNAKGAEAAGKAADAEAEKAKTQRAALLSDETLKQEMAEVLRVDTAWTECPNPTADDPRYRTVLDQAKADFESGWWARLEGVQRKAEILNRLQRDGDLNLTKAYDAARVKICSAVR